MLAALRSSQTRTEQGATSIETVTAGVVAILLVLGVVQLTLVWYARSVVRGAAFDGLRSAQASASGLSSNDSGEISQSTVRRNAPWVERVSTETSTSGDLVQFVVRGEMQGVFPGLVVRIEEKAVGVPERLRPQGL